MYTCMPEARKAFYLMQAGMTRSAGSKLSDLQGPDGAEARIQDVDAEITMRKLDECVRDIHVRGAEHFISTTVGRVSLALGVMERLRIESVM